jgi:ketosteroid isomerase-like protein
MTLPKAQANTQILEKLYAAFREGDYAKMLSYCADGVTFQVAGKSALAGKYDRASFVAQYLKKTAELSNGSLNVEVHDILASDRHGLVLTTESLERNGKKVEYRTVHVWRIEGGKPVAWYSYPRDLYQFDAIWG